MYGGCIYVVIYLDIVFKNNHVWVYEYSYVEYIVSHVHIEKGGEGSEK